MCSARHMGHDIAYTKMEWTYEALSPYFSTITNLVIEQLQHRNCQSGNSMNKSTIKEVGCSWFVCLQLIFELTYDAKIGKIRAASDFRHNVRYKCTDIYFVPDSPLGGVAQVRPNYFEHFVML